MKHDNGKTAAVIGAGLGGLALAIRLQSAGIATTVFEKRDKPGGRAYVRTSHRVGQGRSWVEHWLVKGAGHAWSGGSRAGRFVDPGGPDASAQMLRFFLSHRTTRKTRAALSA